MAGNRVVNFPPSGPRERLAGPGVTVAAEPKLHFRLWVGCLVLRVPCNKPSFDAGRGWYARMFVFVRLRPATTHAHTSRQQTPS